MMRANSHHILLVADEAEEVYEELQTALNAQGWEVCSEHSAAAALERLRTQRFASVIVADGRLEGRVRDILTNLDFNYPSPVISLVAPGDVKTAVDAMKLGSNSVFELGDEQSEPLVDSVVAAISDAIPKGSAPFLDTDAREVIVRAEDSQLNRLLDMLPQIATSDAPVLISGESGTGKELVARTIHNMSGRTGGSFVAVNCSAIPESLLESELFGHRKGAFTGAHRDSEGYLQSADGGTIFLDEIGEMPLQLQVKLLRVLQDKKVYPVGANQPVEVDFRIIAATNRNLEDEIERGNFREDLYYRIGVLPIHIPALRERPEDIPVLATYFLQEQNRINQTHLQGITKETLSLMKRYRWPGNVRELQNLIQRLAILKRAGFIEREDLPPQFHDETQPGLQLGLYVPSEGMDMADTLEELETQLLRDALEKAEGNKAAAARLLGLNRTTLVEKVKRLGIEEND